jgi:aldehyde dehydrogenase
MAIQLAKVFANTKIIVLDLDDHKLKAAKENGADIIINSKKNDPVKVADDTDMGPMVSNDALNNIDSLVLDAKKNGAELLTGGERLEGKGFFYKPTIVTNITDAMRISKEEVFGPLAPVIIVENESEAIELANDTKYGLGASVWTQDIEKAEKVARAVQAGVVTVNNIVSSDPRIPFGGIKNSGFGRELSRYGMLEFVNIKSIRFYDQLVSNHHVE